MRGVGALPQNDGPVASRLSFPSLHRSQGQENPKGVKLCVCVYVHKRFSSANTPRDDKISRPSTRSRAAPLL